MNKTIEKIWNDTIKGCKKKTGYFEGSPYYCGEIVQTTAKDGFISLCKKCQRRIRSLNDIKRTIELMEFQEIKSVLK